MDSLPIPPLSPSHILTILAFLILTHLLTTIIYNRYFHPLSSFPGPPLASISELYRFYHNYIRHGSLYTLFPSLCSAYGPLIRIAPNELLLADPAHYDTIYTAHSRFYKDPSFYSLLGADTLFGITHNEPHRKQRALLNPFFSRRAALEQEDVVHEKTRQLLERIERDSRRGEMTDLGMGFRALSVDVATRYCYGEEGGYDSLGEEDFGRWYNELIGGLAPVMFLLKIFPGWLVRAVQRMPEGLAELANPLVRPLRKLLKEAERQVERVRGEVEKGVMSGRKTIFHTILAGPEDGEGGYVVPEMRKVVGEAFGIAGAAVETTGNVLTVCAFWVLRMREIQERLREELVGAFPDEERPMEYLVLEKLPYLTAVIKEGLRLSYGVLYPLPRVVPKGGATFNGRWVPEGTVVSMSTWLMHRDPSAFPNPDVFDPERWLDPAEERYRDRLVVSFSRGSRACLGQPLAMCELYVVLGQLFRRFDNLEAPDIGPEDLVYEDYFLALHPPHAKKFRVRRKGMTRQD